MLYSRHYLAMRIQRWARQGGFLLLWDHILGGSRQIKARSIRASNKGSEMIKGSECARRWEVTLDWEVKTAELWVTNKAWAWPSEKEAQGMVQRNDWFIWEEERGFCGWKVGGKGEHGLSWGHGSGLIMKDFKSPGSSQRAELSGGHWVGRYQNVIYVFKRLSSVLCGDYIEYGPV